MSGRWCAVCCTDHAEAQVCPGELPATGPERHGWRVNVETPRGIEAYGVLLAESHDVWRARILTYPNVVWLAPNQAGALKFVGRDREEAERRAVDFIRAHCRARRLQMRNATASVGALGAEVGQSAVRKIRFLPVQYGVVTASERGGTGNLSETGLFVITGSPIGCGSWVSLLLNMDRKKARLRGQVRWMRDRHQAGGAPGMGVQLSTPPPSYLHYVRALPAR